MQQADSFQLLRSYSRDGTSGAFTEIVQDYIDLVYSTALRRVNGDRDLAQDVAQLVFVDLAAKAKTLPANVMLGGWLHHHTCYRAATALRSERRRRDRETKAAEMKAIAEEGRNSPNELLELLDQALESLSTRDRNAVVLHYIEGVSLAAVGGMLGISADAAQKRVSRALERMRRTCRRSGIAVPATAAMAAICASSVSAAPPGLAAAIAQAALARIPAAGAISTSGPMYKTILGSFKVKTVVTVTALLALTVLGGEKSREIGRVFSRLRSAVPTRGDFGPSAGRAATQLIPAATGDRAGAGEKSAEDIELRLDHVLEKRLWNNDLPGFQKFLRGLKTSDMRRALAYLDHKTDLAGVSLLERSALLRPILVNRWTELDPRQAIAWVRSLPAGPSADAARSVVANAVSRNDPAAAIQVVGPIPGLYQSWANKAPAAAAASALQLPSGAARAHAVAAVGAGWADADPQGAVRWANGIADPSTRAAALTGILPSLGRDDPAQVASFLATSADQPEMVEVGSRFASTWANSDPAAAAAWATGLPDSSKLREAAVPRVVERWANTDPVAASQWLNTVPQGSARDQLVQIYVKQAAHDEPQIAARLAESLSAHDARDAALEMVGRVWYRVDPTAAGQWLGSTPLPDDRKQELLRELAQGQ